MRVIGFQSMPILAPAVVDRMVAALMTALRERRHIDRRELEGEKQARKIVEELLAAARD
jgi:hypothetical protein